MYFELFFYRKHKFNFFSLQQYTREELYYSRTTTYFEDHPLFSFYISHIHIILYIHYNFSLVIISEQRPCWIRVPLVECTFVKLCIRTSLWRKHDWPDLQCTISRAFRYNCQTVSNDRTTNIGIYIRVMQRSGNLKISYTQTIFQCQISMRNCTIIFI